jgi:histone deacetylase complex regulatory component SIN3
VREYRGNQLDLAGVQREMARLFSEAPDLLERFGDFVPDQPAKPETF